MAGFGCVLLYSVIVRLLNDFGFELVRSIAVQYLGRVLVLVYVVFWLFHDDEVSESGLRRVLDSSRRSSEAVVGIRWSRWFCFLARTKVQSRWLWTETRCFERSELVYPNQVTNSVSRSPSSCH